MQRDITAKYMAHELYRSTIAGRAVDADVAHNMCGTSRTTKMCKNKVWASSIILRDEPYNGIDWTLVLTLCRSFVNPAYYPAFCTNHCFQVS